MISLASFQASAGAVVPALVIGVICISCSKPTDESKMSRGEMGVPVEVATVETMHSDRTVPIVGTLFPKDEATICAEVEGRVEKTTVDFGDRVSKGQDLAQVDTAAYEALSRKAAADVERARATVTNAELNLTRIQALRLNNISSISDLDKAVAEAEQARAEVKAAEAAKTVADLNLARSRVRAPFDSAVTERLVGAGDFAHIGTPLFHIVNDRLIKFITSVPEHLAGEVKKELT